VSNIARLLTKPRIREIAELADRIDDHLGEITDALCDYENADDLDRADQAEARQIAREACYAAMGDAVAELENLKREYSHLLETLK
jgi:hypothetical protein